MLQTLYRNLHTDVDSNFIHHQQKPEVTQEVPQPVVYPDNRIYSAVKRKKQMVTAAYITADWALLLPYVSFCACF